MTGVKNNILKIGVICAVAMALLGVSLTGSPCCAYTSLIPIGPQPGSVTGIVKDASTGLPLENVTVSVPGYGQYITKTDGFFYFDLPSGVLTLYASKSGYHTFSTQISISEGNQTRLDIRLSRMTSPPPSTAATLDAALTLAIPCIGYAGTCYQVDLLHYAPPTPLPTPPNCFGRWM